MGKNWIGRYLHFSNPYFLMMCYVPPTLLAIAPTLRFGAVGLSAVGLLGLVYPVYLMASALAFRSELRIRGFGWISFADSFLLAAAYPRRAWRIPPREEIATPPGYTDTRQGIERVLALLKGARK